MQNVLESLFNPFVNQASPDFVDKVRVVKKDEKGNEVIIYEDFDSKKYQESLGPVDNWSLDNLMKAGINPDFSIHTTDNARLSTEITAIDAYSKIDDFVKLEETGNNGNDVN